MNGRLTINIAAATPDRLPVLLGTPCFLPQTTSFLVASPLLRLHPQTTHLKERRCSRVIPHAANENNQDDSENIAITSKQQLAAAFLSGVVATSAIMGIAGSSPLSIANAQSTLTTEENATIKLFNRSTRSVVFITNLARARDQFTTRPLELPQGAGSGFVWDSQGHIVTNYHVIRGASELRVTLLGGTDYPAQVVGVDEDKDVAVLKIDSEIITDGPLRPLQLGTSSGLQVGQRVFAVGNPFGLDHTLTTGVISGIGREIPAATGRPISDVVQTDAAINPGNSGGPLLDSSGALIGINTAIYSPSGANAGVGFAIPVDIVRSSVEQIIQFGKVVRPILGITFLPDASIEQIGVNGGVLVLDAREGGPASKAGIRGTTRDEYGRLVLGDIILSVDGKKVKNASDLYRALDKSSVGDQLNVEVLRGDSSIVVPITLEASTSLPASS